MKAFGVPWDIGNDGTEGRAGLGCDIRGLYNGAIGVVEEVPAQCAASLVMDNRAEVGGLGSGSTGAVSSIPRRASLVWRHGSGIQGASGSTFSGLLPQVGSRLLPVEEKHRRPSMLSRLSSGLLGSLGGHSIGEVELRQQNSDGLDWEGGGSSSNDNVTWLECTFRAGPAWVEVHRAPTKTVARMREKVATGNAVLISDSQIWKIWKHRVILHFMQVGEYAGENAEWPLTGFILDPVRTSIVCGGPAEVTLRF